MLQCKGFAPKDFQASKAGVAPSLSLEWEELFLGQRVILFGG